MKTQEILDRIAIIEASQGRIESKLDRIINFVMPLNEGPKTEKQLRDEYKAKRVIELRLKRRQRANNSAHSDDKIREKFLWKGGKKRR